MGERHTQSSKSSEFVRARRLQRALESGAPPAFVPPVNAATAAQVAPLSWSAEHDPEVRRHYLEQLFQSSPDGLVIVDLQQHIQCVNRAFQTMFGYGTGELLGQPVDSVILPPDRTAEAHWIAECLRRGESITLESQRRRKNGSLLDVSLASAPLAVDGKTVAWYAIYRDISQRKHAEAVSSALYRIAEKTSSAHDLQQFFAAIHGIVDELMYARNFSIALYDEPSQLLSFPYFVDEQDSAPLPRKLGCGLTEHVLRSGEPLLCTPEILRQLVKRGAVENGNEALVDWLGVPLTVNHRTFGSLVVQSYSQTARFTDRDKEILTFVSRQLAGAIEHKRNEQALRRSEARHRSLVQTAVHGIYRSSYEGRFLDVNPALIGMLGYNSPAEVLALDPEQDVFVDPREHSRLIEEFRRTGRMDGFEVRWKRKDGSAITVRISGRAVASADEPADVLEAIAEDITERRVLEDQFRQAQKMEAVGRLAGGIAHDFNNLLMVISGYTEVLLSQLDPSHPLHLKAQSIQQASDRATTLTRQLLAFSRKQLLELKVVDVNAIVADMERLLRPLIGENIDLSTRLAADVGCTRADAGQLEQVIMNLVVNAKDAMPNGGKIVIRTDIANLDESYRREHTFIKPGPYVMIAVRDTGHGMDRDTQARIFEPFFTTKEKGKGTGLGLSTVYGIIKQSGGYIFVQSEVGRGTSFTIYLPRVDEPSEVHGVTPASAATSGGSETVLLVEDEESVRQLVRETLETRGYRVLEAENGQTALATAQRFQENIDLLITDVVMPGMSGHELVQQLLKLRPEVKVLYLSGYTEDAFAAEGAPENKAFLQKPFTLQNLSRKVREVLGPAAQQ
jgi:two-component system, cell cycle sensor histidine kinase and response regulator CckA